MLSANLQHCGVEYRRKDNITGNADIRTIYSGVREPQSIRIIFMMWFNCNWIIQMSQASKSIRWNSWDGSQLALAFLNYASFLLCRNVQ